MCKYVHTYTSKFNNTQMAEGSVAQVVMSFPEPHGVGALATNLAFLSASHKVSVCCSVLHCVALCCTVLQCVAMCWCPRHQSCFPLGFAQGVGLLQRVVMCCNVLQCVAMCCNVLQCVAMCCNV